MFTQIDKQKYSHQILRVIIYRSTMGFEVILLVLWLCKYLHIYFWNCPKEGFLESYTLTWQSANNSNTLIINMVWVSPCYTRERAVRVFVEDTIKPRLWSTRVRGKCPVENFPIICIHHHLLYAKMWSYLNILQTGIP